jgi:hypothetical protein
MDKDAIGLAVRHISMMVQILLNAIETMHGNEATARAFEMPLQRRSNRITKHASIAQQLAIARLLDERRGLGQFRSIIGARSDERSEFAYRRRRGL